MTEQKTTLRQEYDTSGYCIARGAIDKDLAGELMQHVHWLGEKYPDVRPERLGHGLLVADPFMHRLVCDEQTSSMMKFKADMRFQTVMKTIFRVRVKKPFEVSEDWSSPVGTQTA